MSDEPAPNTTWGHVRQPASWAEIPPPAKIWSSNDWERIRRGFRPQQMEDKWNAFVEDKALVLEHGWALRAIYEAHFEEVDDGWRIRAARVADDATGYRRGSDEYETLRLEVLIDCVLLGRESDEYWKRHFELRPRR